MRINNQKGFSLVELMIVIAILAILLAIAVPSFQRFAINTDLKNAAREIAGDFFLCKESAIAENTQYEITFFDKEDEIYKVRLPASDKVIKIYTRDKLQSLRGEVSFVSVTPTRYTFQPRGTVTMGSINLINNLGSTATITINITGKTYVEFNMQ